MTATPFIELLSPAKVNIFLEVLSKRADGFHELETVMLRTDLCDTLRFERNDTEAVTLHLSEASLPELTSTFPLDDSNLILKAAHALRAATNKNGGTAITIEKRIPAEAGLAGGSSNAATTLIALNQLWDLHLPQSELHKIAATLGSDINFFVEDCRAALCRGRGEDVTPIAMNGQLHIVAARPTTGNSTPQVFAGVQPTLQLRSTDSVVAALISGEGVDWNRLAFNRLTESAITLNPQMADLLAQMQTICDRPAFMSGSGSTCFVFCRSAEEADGLQRQLSESINAELTFLRALTV